jgi:hypothetical protein
MSTQHFLPINQDLIAFALFLPKTSAAFIKHKKRRIRTRIGLLTVFTMSAKFQSIWDLWEKNLLKYEELFMTERNQPELQQKRESLD